MKSQLPFILLLLLSPVCRSLGQTAISLAPWFGDGMVLQRSPNTLLQGSGPAGQTLEITLSSGSTGWLFGNHSSWSWKVPVNGSGQWKTNLDLSLSKFQSSGKHWSLRIEEEKKKKNGLDYTNILIGDVIIVAGWEHQGLPAGTPDFVSDAAYDHLDRNRDHIRFLDIRFLDLTHSNLAEDLKQASGAGWEDWPEHPSDLDRYSTLTLRLACELAESKISKISTNHYIGIVLASRPLVEDALKTPKAAEHLDTNIWNWIAADVLKAQTIRSTNLVYNKRQNIVSNIPPVVAYDPARLALWEAFDSSKPPGDLFSFAGAIWSAPRGAP